MKILLLATFFTLLSAESDYTIKIHHKLATENEYRLRYDIGGRLKEK